MSNAERGVAFSAEGFLYVFYHQAGIFGAESGRGVFKNNIISIIRQEYLVQRVEEEPLLNLALKYHLLNAEQKANLCY